MSDVVVEIENVTKSFDSLVAVDQVSLRVERGQTLGLIGPNGGQERRRCCESFRRSPGRTAATSESKVSLSATLRDPHEESSVSCRRSLAARGT